MWSQAQRTAILELSAKQVQTRDRTGVATIAPDRAQSATFQLHPGPGNPTGTESRTLSALVREAEEPVVFC
jgi:hypothetical protein